MDYKTYLDKVYGCFLAKTIYGTLGAPYEGIKMPMDIEFSPEMIDVMLPNDDLDLQVLWLEVVEKRGFDFTPGDLLNAFVANCDYSPGEYAVMRKNHDKGIAPPASGRFCNDFYNNGMGSPIRSEIWACLAAGNPALAAELAARDGVLDHSGDSVYGEMFFAALESAAFFESDLLKLIDTGLAYVPESRIKELILDSVEWSKTCGTYKEALFLLLKRYGHPDCTNVYQNIGIILLSMLFSGGDVLKASMTALNSGFDTDCTCATLASVFGIIAGADRLCAEQAVSDTKVVLSVIAHRRSDSCFDLSEDIALLGAHFAGCENDQLDLPGKPETSFCFEQKPDFTAVVEYDSGVPSIEIGGSRDVTITIFNHSAESKTLNLSVESDSVIVVEPKEAALAVPGRGEAMLNFRFSLDANVETVHERNLFTLIGSVGGSQALNCRFGLSAAAPYKLIGPFWKTDPVFTTEQIKSVKNYFELFKAVEDGGKMIDQVRGFHVYLDLDDQQFISHEQAFAPYNEADYQESLVHIHEDSFRLDTLYGFQGPTVGYLARKIVSDEDIVLGLQIGHTDPFELFINGVSVAKSADYRFFTGENLHIADVTFKKGVNNMLVRFTKTTPDAKLSFIFSRGLTCCEHYTRFGSVNPRNWGSI